MGVGVIAGVGVDVLCSQKALVAPRSLLARTGGQIDMQRCFGCGCGCWLSRERARDGYFYLSSTHCTCALNEGR